MRRVTNGRIRSEMRHWLSIGVVLMAVLGPPPPSPVPKKIRDVAVPRGLNQCDAGKRAKSEFQGKIQALDSKLQRQQNDVVALKDELEKKGMLMQPDQRQNLQDEYGKKMKDLDRNVKDAREDLQRQDNEVTGK